MPDSDHDGKVGIHTKPDWLKIRLPLDETFAEVARIARHGTLHTICESGRCPNRAECWSRRTATFMILGDTCTRSCRFCATATGKGLPIDPREPAQVADSIHAMGLRHAVVTSVTRDDLPDGGAAHWVAAVEAIRAVNPQTTIELLIPDFDAREALIDRVVAARPDIIGHNIETVRRLTPIVRSRAQYETSLKTLAHIAVSGITAKSGLMVGLGETRDEVLETLDDLAAAGVRIVTIGQYLRPTLAHIAVSEYVTPAIFEFYRVEALKRGFDYVASAPLVRSSYMAHKALEACQPAASGGMSVSLLSPPPGVAAGCDLCEVGCTDLGLIDYEACLAIQREVFESADQQLILCEHPPVYTLGKSGREENILVGDLGARVYRTDRGGDITFHGPGQLVGYPILDLDRLKMGLKAYIHALEEIVIRVLQDFGIQAVRSEGATGVWLENPMRKICAIGVRASRGRVMHGFALNVNTDLSYFERINPCGFTDRGVTSMARELGTEQDMQAVKEALAAHFQEIINCKIKNKPHVHPKTMEAAPPGRPRPSGGVGSRAGTLARAGEPADPARHHQRPTGPPIL